MSRGDISSPGAAQCPSENVICPNIPHIGQSIALAEAVICLVVVVENRAMFSTSGKMTQFSISFMFGYVQH